MPGVLTKRSFYLLLIGCRFWPWRVLTQTIKPRNRVALNALSPNSNWGTYDAENRQADMPQTQPM